MESQSSEKDEAPEDAFLFTVFRLVTFLRFKLVVAGLDLELDVSIAAVGFSAPSLARAVSQRKLCFKRKKTRPELFRYEIRTTRLREKVAPLIPKLKVAFLLYSRNLVVRIS